MSSPVGIVVKAPATIAGPTLAVQWPLVSVVTPSYNQGAFIERCIQSVLAQDYPNFEHIVYDNCSTDGTLDVLRRYPHLTWVSEPDCGQSDALNKALRRAQGEIIAWINADDYYLRGAFALAVRELRRETGIMAIAGRVHLVDSAGRVQDTTTPHFEGLDYLTDFWTHHYGLCQPGVLFRREVLERVGYFRTDLHYAMDYEYWLRLAAHFPVRTVDAVLAGYIVHPASKTGSSNFGTGFIDELERVARPYWGPWWSRRRWQRARSCRRFRAYMLAHAVVAAHQRGNLNWPLIGQLAVWRPWFMLDRTLAVTMLEHVWRRARILLGLDAGKSGDASASRAALEMHAGLRNGRVSVIIPTYNRAALTDHAVCCVLAQTVRDHCDIVVIDDGSTDDTRNMLRPQTSEIRLLHQANRGVSAARNAGLQATLNEFTAFLDSDDEWAPHKLERQLAALLRHPEAVFASCRSVFRRPDGGTWAPQLPGISFDRPVDLAPHLFERVFLPTPTMLVRTRYLLRTGLFSPNLRRGEDYLLWLRLACQGPGIVLDEELVTCSDGAPLSLTRDPVGVLLDEIRVRYRMRRELRLRPDCRPAWRRGLANMLAALRDRAYRVGDYGRAARFGLHSLLVKPTMRPRWEWGRPLYALWRSLSQ